MNYRKFNHSSLRCFAVSLLFAIPLVVLSSPLSRRSLAAAAVGVVAQRDHLTPQEGDLVREAQEIDRRIDVFIKAVDRRFLVLANPQAAAASKQVQKDLETWGELPKGTQAELLGDLAKIFNEAITNIDDAGTRSAQSKLVPKALRKLAESSTRFLAQLTPLRATVRQEAEREVLEQTIESAQEIIQAATKLPPPDEKKK